MSDSDDDGPRRRGPRLGLMPSVVLIVVFGSIAVTAAAFYMQQQEGRRRVAKAEAVVKQTQQQMEKMKDEYETYLTNLLGERRAAEVRVLAQDRDEDGRTWTKLKFLEYGADGSAMAPKVFTVPGVEVYFDALVMQFQADRVKEGKAKSLYLFRRVFTDKTRPDMGCKIFEFDDSPDVPQNYAKAELPIEPQREVWERFQKCIADKAYAEALGVRTVFGQATYKTLRKNHLYVLTIQDNGGLIIEEKPFAAILRDEGQG